jgi:ABC-type uncharacterized transport system ATPase subunit
MLHHDSMMCSVLVLLREESQRCGVTVVYCTHIFDGLEDWATHMMHLDKGAIRRFGRCQDFQPTHEDTGTAAGSGGSSMFATVKDWLGAHHV